MKTIYVVTEGPAFDQLVAGFDDQPRCEMLTAAATRCDRPAEYFAICHECGRGLICTACVQRFRAQLGAGSIARCNRCGRIFASINDAMTVVEL